MPIRAEIKRATTSKIMPQIHQKNIEYSLCFSVFSSSAMFFWNFTIFLLKKNIINGLIENEQTRRKHRVVFALLVFNYCQDFLSAEQSGCLWFDWKKWQTPSCLIRKQNTLTTLLPEMIVQIAIPAVIIITDKYFLMSYRRPKIIMPIIILVINEPCNTRKSHSKSELKYHLPDSTFKCIFHLQGIVTAQFIKWETWCSNENNSQQNQLSRLTARMIICNGIGILKSNA